MVDIGNSSFKRNVYVVYLFKKKLGCEEKIMLDVS